jgi:DUF2075 family protein
LTENALPDSEKLANWPVVYLLDNGKRLYVGETVNFLQRYRHHSNSPTKRDLTEIRVILDDTFNKSACLDLESNLIRYFASDTKFEVTNLNLGTVNVNYYDRESYRKRFKEIYEQLRKEGLFNLSISEIENSDIYKLSPYTSLNDGQSNTTEHVVSSVRSSLEDNKKRTFVIEGGAGTGKSVLLTYLAKLFADANGDDTEIGDPDEYGQWTDLLGLQDLIKTRHQRLKIAVVIPQQSLKATIDRIFSKISNLRDVAVFSPLSFGKCDEYFDLVLVDEGHRLRRRANSRDNNGVVEINKKLFGEDRLDKTEFDWIKEKSNIQIIFIDPHQRVRPSDLTLKQQFSIINEAKGSNSYFQISQQERLGKGGAEYLEHLPSIITAKPDGTGRFKANGYDLRIYRHLGKMIKDLNGLDQEFGLCRLISGYGFKQVTRKDRKLFDIELDGVKLRWNSRRKDWIDSVNGLEEVGSIHTVQGYDLNYAGVIFAPEISFDKLQREFKFHKNNYFDSAKDDNHMLGETYDDTYHLNLILNIYRVLLSRGTRGTFIYCVDDGIREFLCESFEIEDTR